MPAFTSGCRREVVDESTTPEQLGEIVPEGAIGIDVDPARKLIFVADTVRGLLILRDDT